MSTLLLLIQFLFESNALAAKGQLHVELAGEYRTINIFGQDSGVPTYRGITITPEVRYGVASADASLFLYANYGFGTLENTANRSSLMEKFKYRVLSTGLGFSNGWFWARGGLNYHRSRDEVSGSVIRTINFHGVGIDGGIGFKFELSRRLLVDGGLRFQAAKFSSESSTYFRGRRDYLSYAGVLGLMVLLPSAAWK